jgi:hypothetical protein
MTAIRTVEEASMSEPAILTIVCFVILSATLIISEKVRASRVEEVACQIVQGGVGRCGDPPLLQPDQDLIVQRVDVLVLQPSRVEAEGRRIP